MKLSNDGMVKQVRNIENILNHVTAHENESQAMLKAKMVDRNGPDFDIKEKSQKIQKKSKVALS